ncbi:hypothetical protein L3556_00910 [Candidatus Synechococcus calcipolaris G9]|uniref:Uncharacterized protein n=1 Tax=Candidatus Synechococcus calcipolaris G9 TaxID=1497997 RepID=A0ABT6EUH7_9SYNE|nr:hypothetical protein [Candidatus Synechococcus calcipolaris]MDG2989498.1 hypothetical protein [Candidatus Synechococcus calcipolaris G9]
MQSPFSGGLDRFAAMSSDATMAQTMLSTLIGIGIGYCLSQENAQEQPTPQGSPNPYRNQTPIVTIVDLERWVMENQGQLPQAERILRDLAQLPQEQRVTQQLVRDLLPPARR